MRKESSEGPTLDPRSAEDGSTGDESTAEKREHRAAESSSFGAEAGAEDPGVAGGFGPAGDEAAPDGAQDSETAILGDEIAGQYLDQLQRLRAEFDNYRKRTLRDKEQWWRQAKADLLQELLPVLDDRARAEAFSEVLDVDGLQQILKKLVETLTQIGLEAMETDPGTTFDPEMHEAFMTAPSSEVAAGKIVSTLESGYSFEGEILRRAKVSVSSGPATDDG